MAPSQVRVSNQEEVWQRLCIHDGKGVPKFTVKDRVRINTYDAMTIVGGMGDGLIPTRAMTELIRIVKPGGYVCIITREEYVDEVAEYVDRLEPFMKQLVEQGAWTRKERKVVPNHVYGRNGVVFVFRVKQSGAPSVTSTQFTK
ncbi:hypothetical protein LSAT2_009667 [Lamellibrachia satsuma]|nr:hypothetical protein LSAT2_009667 [Lamellibrachia satsuma]